MENDNKITKYEIKSSLDKDGTHLYTQISQPIHAFKLLGLIGEVMQEDGPILKKLKTLRDLTESVYGLQDQEDLMRVQGTGVFYELSAKAKGYNYSPARILTVGESLIALAEPAKEVFDKNNHHVFDTILELESCLNPDVALSACGIASEAYDTREHAARKNKNSPKTLEDLYKLIPLVEPDTITFKGDGPILECSITMFGSTPDFPDLGIGLDSLIKYHAQRFGPLTLTDVKKEMEKIGYGKNFDYYVYNRIASQFADFVLGQNVMSRSFNRLKKLTLSLYKLEPDEAFFNEYFKKAFEKKMDELVKQGSTLFRAFRTSAKRLNMKTYPSYLYNYRTDNVDASKTIKYYIMRQVRNGRNIIDIIDKLKKKLPIPEDERTEVQLIDIGLYAYQDASNLYFLHDLIKDGKKHGKNLEWQWEGVGLKRPILTTRDSKSVENGVEILKKLRSKYPEKIPYEPHIKTFVEG